LFLVIVILTSPPQTRLEISDQKEIFIVNLTNFSSIDQIGSSVITFFWPLMM